MNAQTIDVTRLEAWEVVLLRSAHSISLSPPHYQLIEKRYETLQTILNSSNEPLLKDAHIFIQGSIRLKTTVKPAPGATDELATVDADAVVWLPNALSATAAEVLRVIEECFRAGVRVDAPIEPLRRGIRIVYSDENPGFHIDITPARCAPGNNNSHGRGHLQVPDRQTGWKNSSPILYSDWLENAAEQRIQLTGLEALSKRHIALAEATQEPLPAYDDYVSASPLQAAIKLLKRHRDAWSIRHKRQSVRPISAVLTTLATHAYLEVAAESAGGVQRPPLRPVEAIIAIVDRMAKFISGGPGNYQVLNPEDAGENFAEKWNRPNGEGFSYRTAFDEWHVAARSDVRMGLQDLGSASAFEDMVSSRFGVAKTMLQETIDSLPANWTLPGRAPGFSANKQRLSALVGGSAATDASQTKIKPVDRLG